MICLGFCTFVFGSSAVGFLLDKIGKLRVLMQGELFVSSLVCMSFNADVINITILISSNNSVSQTKNKPCNNSRT